MCTCVILYVCIWAGFTGKYIVEKSDMLDDRKAIIMFITGGLCLICAVILVVYDHFRIRRILYRMQHMLDTAIDGTFQENTFDESLYSATESRLAKYLGASEILARKTAEEKDRIKTLIADISHQTKTPLANILLYTELLQEQEQSAEGRENLELLANQAQKLQFLIASLVKLSRLETGILALQPNKTAVFCLLEDAEKQFASQAKEKGLYLHIPVGEAQDIMACFDRKWTAEALGNIIDNAVKYTDQGGVSVRVKPYQLFVCIEVSDTGRGIPEEEQAKVFGRFYRSPEAAGQAGVGIGLYLAREILRQESGYIKVSSKEGEGTAFSMYLPVD